MEVRGRGRRRRRISTAPTWPDWLTVGCATSSSSVDACFKRMARRQYGVGGPIRSWRVFYCLIWLFVAQLLTVEACKATRVVRCSWREVESGQGGPFVRSCCQLPPSGQGRAKWAKYTALPAHRSRHIAFLLYFP